MMQFETDVEWARHDWARCLAALFSEWVTRNYQRKIMFADNSCHAADLRIPAFGESHP